MSLTELPIHPDTAQIYRLEPKDPNPLYYAERTDRNIPWITEAEQYALLDKVVGIAGCGGMGAAIAQIFLRLGVGEIRIADPEVFEVSNINRQFAARRDTVGQSKAFATAHMLRAISDDTTIVVYPQGLTEHTVESFVDGCDLIIDEIEFWNVGSCIVLHQAARTQGIPIVNGLTVGFASYLHLFEPESMAVETMLGFSRKEALALEHHFVNRTASQSKRDRVMQAVLAVFVPDLPQYFTGPGSMERNAFVLRRLQEEGKAPILATNPPLAAGLVADRALLRLLADDSRSALRSVATLPAAPGYVVIDALRFTITIVPTRSVVVGTKYA
ncbi:MAG: ThiF family adenylyltransferase [Patescibacteria group bacterium]